MSNEIRMKLHSYEQGVSPKAGNHRGSACRLKLNTLKVWSVSEQSKCNHFRHRCLKNKRSFEVDCLVGLNLATSESEESYYVYFEKRVSWDFFWRSFTKRTFIEKWTLFCFLKFCWQQFFRSKLNFFSLSTYVY